MYIWSPKSGFEFDHNFLARRIELLDSDLQLDVIASTRLEPTPAPGPFSAMDFNDPETRVGLPDLCDSLTVARRERAVSLSANECDLERMDDWLFGVRLLAASACSGATGTQP